MKTLSARWQEASPALRVALVVGPLLVAAIGWWATDAPLVLDDFTYMLLSLLHREDTFGWLDGRKWFMHWRPLFYLSWWGLAPLSLDGAAVRAFQVVLWTGTALVVGLAAWRRRGPWVLPAVALGLPLNMVVLDLLGWKSWLTSTGTLLGLAIGVLELTRERPRALGVALAGLLALGFKETGPFALGVLALAMGPMRVRAVGLGLVGAALLAASSASGKLEPAAVVQNALVHLGGMGPHAWWIPIAVVTWRRDLPWWALLPIPLVLLLPAHALGAVVALAGFALVARRPAFLLALAASWGVAQLGMHTAPQYLLEGALLVLLALVLEHPPIARRDAWAVAAVLAVPFLGHVVNLRAERHAVAAEQRAFLDGFDPEPVRELYIPPEGYRIELDVLVWLSHGVDVLDDAPTNSRPLAVGPRSGIWAGVEPVDPDRPMLRSPSAARGAALRKLPASEVHRPQRR